VQQTERRRLDGTLAWGTRPGKSIQPQALEINGLGEVSGLDMDSGLQSKQVASLHQRGRLAACGLKRK
jgi:hypothetical protein